MNKNCSRYPPASRADTGDSLSRQFECRKTAFGLENAGTEISEMSGIDENNDSVFLMNRFYGEKLILPMIECVKKEFTGDIGLSVANRLEKEMLEKNGYIKGDALLELLKSGLGLECAVSLIGQMDRFKKMGLYGDNIVTRLSQPSVCQSSLSGDLTKERQRKAAVGECTDREKEMCEGCIRKKAGEENGNWKKNPETK